MTGTRIFEGTWEEVARQAEPLAGKKVRLIILEHRSAELGVAAHSVHPATPAGRVRAWDEWCGLPRPHAPPLSDDAVSRESIYSLERE